MLRHALSPICLLTALLLASGCAEDRVADEPEAPQCVSPIGVDEPLPPPDPSCANDSLTSYDALLVLAPHPDDEVLGFSGLITSYLAQGKPVEVVVVTDGDAYCDACRFWKSGTVSGETCSAADLSNFSTEAVDSFAEIRRGESTTAMEILGFGPPTFLGYPDTGLAAAWANLEADAPERRLRRSDFSMCEACETCAGGYGEGPETELTATSLREALTERIAGGSERTLIATTHWLDGHGDHAALGNFVKSINDELDSPRSTAFAVIHAHTPNGAPHPDCWYPGPRALACPCFDEECASQDPGWLAALRDYRFRPEWPGGLPDDTDYGEEAHLCLPEEMYLGDDAKKLAAVRSYASQLGFAAREGSVPPELGGIMDCNGYLISFVRRTEAFAYVERPAAAGGM
jgi:LmbE family N-acetylglucosaminyl deacetylase